MYGMVLGPALGFVNVFPFRYSFVADHFQYLASLPILAFFVGSIFWLLQTRLSPVVISALVILLVGGPLAVLTRAQSREYVDANTLYLKTIEHNPTAWLAYNNLPDRARTHLPCSRCRNLERGAEKGSPASARPWCSRRRSRSFNSTSAPRSTG